MGRRGPPPKPRGLRLLDGTHPERINEDEPLPPPGLPEPPDDIADDVREVWEFTVANLDAMNVASRVDRDALLIYCEAVATHREASRILARPGMHVVIPGQRPGTLIKHPCLDIQRQAAMTVLRFAQEFGLTPASRTRINVQRDQAEVDNPFAGTGTL
ncbi:MAG TPA: phage terminase small subunit P27 family [Nocardioidaceae bacterium]|nr:phage terminase small subunit P27 family [Nocardioidaceae bacterium]